MCFLFEVTDRQKQSQPTEKLKGLPASYAKQSNSQQCYNCRTRTFSIQKEKGIQ